MFKPLIITLCISIALCVSCEKAEKPGSADSGPVPYLSPDEKGDKIPDFSHVGYHWGDDVIPSYPVGKALMPPLDGSDATSLIQKAINALPSHSALLLKAGRYVINGSLSITRSDIVIRGEGDATVLYADGSTQRTLIKVSEPAFNRTFSTTVDIDEEYVPVGRMYVDVADASPFAKGDCICVYRPATSNWISDLRMDKIPQNSTNTVVQWNPANFNLYWERRVVSVEGNRIYLDNPIVMSIDRNYGGGQVLKCNYAAPRVSEVGIENLRLESYYASNADEDHAWTAIEFSNAEQCWVKGVKAYYFGFAAVHLGRWTKHVTVDGCECHEAKSVVTGSRRYSFHIEQAEMCLVKNCVASDGRHDFVTGAITGGPNVFYRGTATRTLNEIGPHHRWATGTLYDCIKSDGIFTAQDRDNMGTGHGWAGANQVFWNCEGSQMICQNPWVSAKNYCVGFIGKKNPGVRNGRPDGEWWSHGKHVSPESLYETQMGEGHVNMYELFN